MQCQSCLCQEFIRVRTATDPSKGFITLVAVQLILINSIEQEPGGLSHSAAQMALVAQLLSM